MSSGPRRPRARLHKIADDECAKYEQAGRISRHVNWRVQQDDLHDLLDNFLAADNEFRRKHSATPHRVELDFGAKYGPHRPLHAAQR